MAEVDAATSRRHRLTLRSHADDGAISASATTITVSGDLSLDDLDRLEAVLVDPLLETGSWQVTVAPEQLDIGLIPGVTDTAAAQVVHAAELLGMTIDDASVGRIIDITGAPDDAEIRRRWANAVIERWSLGTVVEPGFAAGAAVDGVTEHVDLPADDAALSALGKARGLALDLAELHVIREHFAGVGRPPTDAELETLAQTWSEHCAHKSFRADIVPVGAGADAAAAEPLLARLRRSTSEIAAPFVVSAFDGNAGIVQFGPGRTYALKCETHNHPSAIEPFGGANTGVGGVIRDIIGAHHRAIACTNILCFGPADTPDAELPDGVLSPRRIIDGVVAGVADYGNKIGLPTVAGGVLYDPAYISNPLVFAGCIGVAPSDRPALTGPNPGDRVVVFGGRTGRDGIRGATFSSMEMDATTGDVAGASVQIGDPIIEKLVSDLLIDAWDLYTAITDCGAGGLSSAIGELADGIGADVELAKVPLKYAGLAPWEIWLSEAQERMVVAVAPHQLDALTEMATLHGVEISDLGSFTGDRTLVVRFEGEPVIELDTDFLHDGRPRRRLEAVMPSPQRDDTVPPCDDTRAALLALLAHPNIASKADIIRRYDHEILGATVIRPLTGVRNDAPADGVVLVDPRDTDGIAIGIGVNPWYGLHDPERMAWAVVDEAIRNVVVTGADPSAIALMDNFSWGNPTRSTTFGELVAAVDGCVAAAHAYGAPFVSGKDSLNNEYLTADGTRRAIPPTLVITAVAPVRDVTLTVTPDLKRPGNPLVLLGRTLPEFGGSHLSMLTGDHAAPGPTVPAPDPTAAARYRTLHAAIGLGYVDAAHDCSEGGLGVALAEMCIGGRIGAAIELAPVDADPVVALFSESAGRIVCEVATESLDEFLRLFADAGDVGGVTVIGHVADSPTLCFDGVFEVPGDELVAAFKGGAR
ncbi:MAG: purS [Ilumatobacteraceae bacterium]|nr:purS [Ilumatobacteraceae bacterium]